MNANIKWLDNPEIFRVNQLDAHSDHSYYVDYADMKEKDNPLSQSLNGQWAFAFSKNAASRPCDFYKEGFDDSGFDKIMEDYKDKDDEWRPFVSSYTDHFTLTLPDLTNKGVMEEDEITYPYVEGLDEKNTKKIL